MTTKETLLKEVVRLVQEIGEDEKMIIQFEKLASETFVEYRKTYYKEQADNIGKSLNRKIELLCVLRSFGD